MSEETLRGSGTTPWPSNVPSPGNAAGPTAIHPPNVDGATENKTPEYKQLSDTSPARLPSMSMVDDLVKECAALNQELGMIAAEKDNLLYYCHNAEKRNAALETEVIRLRHENEKRMSEYIECSGAYAEVKAQLEDTRSQLVEVTRCSLEARKELLSASDTLDQIKRDLQKLETKEDVVPKFDVFREEAIEVIKFLASRWTPCALRRHLDSRVPAAAQSFLCAWVDSQTATAPSNGTRSRTSRASIDEDAGRTDRSTPSLPLKALKNSMSRPNPSLGGVTAACEETSPGDTQRLSSRGSRKENAASRRRKGNRLKGTFSSGETTADGPGPDASVAIHGENFDDKLNNATSKSSRKGGVLDVLLSKGTTAGENGKVGGNSGFSSANVNSFSAKRRTHNSLTVVHSRESHEIQNSRYRRDSRDAHHGRRSCPAPHLDDQEAGRIESVPTRKLAAMAVCICEELERRKKETPAKEHVGASESAKSQAATAQTKRAAVFGQLTKKSDSLPDWKPKNASKSAISAGADNPPAADGPNNSYDTAARTFTNASCQNPSSFAQGYESDKKSGVMDRKFVWSNVASPGFQLNSTASEMLVRGFGRPAKMQSRLSAVDSDKVPATTQNSQVQSRNDDHPGGAVDAKLEETGMEHNPVVVTRATRERRAARHMSRTRPKRDASKVPSVMSPATSEKLRSLRRIQYETTISSSATPRAGPEPNIGSPPGASTARQYVALQKTQSQTLLSSTAVQHTSSPTPPVLGTQLSKDLSRAIHVKHSYQQSVSGGAALNLAAAVASRQTTANMLVETGNVPEIIQATGIATARKSRGAPFDKIPTGSTQSNYGASWLGSLTPSHGSLAAQSGPQNSAPQQQNPRPFDTFIARNVNPGSIVGMSSSRMIGGGTTSPGRNGGGDIFGSSMRVDMMPGLPRMSLPGLSQHSAFQGFLFSNNLTQHSSLNPSTGPSAGTAPTTTAMNNSGPPYSMSQGVSATTRGTITAAGSPSMIIRGGLRLMNPLAPSKPRVEDAESRDDCLRDAARKRSAGGGAPPTPQNGNASLRMNNDLTNTNTSAGVNGSVHRYVTCPAAKGPQVGSSITGATMNIVEPTLMPPHPSLRG